MHNEKGVLRTVMGNEVAFFHTYWYFLKSYIPTQRDAQFICCDVSLPSAPASAFMPCEPCSHRSYQHIPCCFSGRGHNIEASPVRLTPSSLHRGNCLAIRPVSPGGSWLLPTIRPGRAYLCLPTATQSLLIAASFLTAHPPFPDLFLK